MLKSPKLESKTFILSQTLILLVSLVLIGILYYFLNLQYPTPLTNFSTLGGPITSEPKSLLLTVEEPENDKLVFKSTTLISGKTTPNLPVLISTESQDLVINSKGNGTFSTSLELDLGVNQIQVSVFDGNGDSRSETRIVYYSEEKL